MSVPIKREDIRKGDRIRIQYEVDALADGMAASSGASPDVFELMERPVVLPTEPGIYADKDGYPWILHASVPNCAQHWRLDTDAIPDSGVQGFAPFTLLRPIAEVAADIADKLEEQGLYGAADYLRTNIRGDAA
jgi:hypothetical protein